jgi:hypothetical protein
MDAELYLWLGVFFVLILVVAAIVTLLSKGPPG